MAIDPVCGMSVDEKMAKANVAHAGKTWYFCSGRCRQMFASDSDKYAGVGEATTRSLAAADHSHHTTTA